MTNHILDLSLNESPDAAAIVAKGVVDISLSISDVSASLMSGSLTVDSITLNPTKQKIVVCDDGSDGVYFTPIHTERLSYTEWQRTVNKTFEELSI